MEVQHKDNPQEGSFYVEKDGKTEAEMTYKHSGKHQVTIDHTEVSDGLKGQGIGHKLVNAAVDYLRENNLKAKAECPFVKSVFDKKSEELSDVIA